jgi:hypothetical protein
VFGKDLCSPTISIALIMRILNNVAEPQHFDGAPAPGKSFGAAPGKNFQCGSGSYPFICQANFFKQKKIFLLIFMMEMNKSEWEKETMLETENNVHKMNDETFSTK